VDFSFYYVYIISYSILYRSLLDWFLWDFILLYLLRFCIRQMPIMQMWNTAVWQHLPLDLLSIDLECSQILWHQLQVIGSFEKKIIFGFFNFVGYWLHRVSFIFLDTALHQIIAWCLGFMIWVGESGPVTFHSVFIFNVKTSVILI